MTDDELTALRVEAEALGVKVDGRWGADRLRSEIEAAQPEPPGDDEPADDEPEPPGDDEPDDDEPDDDEPEGEPGPAPVRAGGYIDRGDGRGWVLEE